MPQWQLGFSQSSVLAPTPKMKPIMLLCLFAPLATAQMEGNPGIEIQFEPMGPGMLGPQDLMRTLSGPGPMPVSGPDLGSLFGSLVSGMGNQGSARRQRGMSHSEFSDMLAGPGGSSFVMQLGGSPGMHPMSAMMPSTLSASVVTDLFPMPIQRMEGPFGMGDDHLANMLQHVTDRFAQDMLPAIHHAVHGSAGRDACKRDAAKLTCNAADSALHCLGQNQDQISEDCRSSVGKSVPFVCSSSIDLYCDVLQRGILPCLADHLDKLDAECRDSVIATHSVIAQVGTYKTSVLDPATGTETVHVPTTPTAALSEPPLVSTPTSPLAENHDIQQRPTIPLAAATLDAAARLLADGPVNLGGRLRFATGRKAADDFRAAVTKNYQDWTWFHFGALAALGFVGLYIVRSALRNPKAKRGLMGGPLLELEEQAERHMF